MKHLVVAWNLASGHLIGEWFGTSRGQQILRIAKALFHRFGLEQQLDMNRPGGAWFFEPLADGSGELSNTVSELKWRIWCAIAIRFLDCPIPDVALGYLIAADYFWRLLPPGDYRIASRGGRYAKTPACQYISLKLTRVLLEEPETGASDEEIAMSLEVVVNRLPAALLPQSRLSDAVRLFQCSSLVLDLTHIWLLFQLGPSNNESFQWLAAQEARASAPDRSDLDKLLLYYLENTHRFDPTDVPLILGDAQILTGCSPKLEWKGLDLRPGFKQVLQELLQAQAAAGGVLLLGDDHERLKHWLLDHSLVRSGLLNRLVSNYFVHTQVSGLMGRLVYTWTQTRKGRHDYYSQLHAAAGGSDFAAHVKSTLGLMPSEPQRGSDAECQALYDAAAAVFGARFSGQFITLCAYSFFDSSTEVALSEQEVEEVRGMVTNRGVFRVANPLPIKPVRNTWLNDMVLYLIHLIVADRVQCTQYDREKWIENAQELLDSLPNQDIPALGDLEVSLFGSWVCFTEICTERICREFESWLYAPGTAAQMGASVEEMNGMMRRAVLDDARQHDEAGRRMIVRMAELLELDEDEVYSRVETYVKHGGIEAASRRNEHEYCEWKRYGKKSVEFPTPVQRRLQKEARCRAMIGLNCCYGVSELK